MAMLVSRFRILIQKLFHFRTAENDQRRACRGRSATLQGTVHLQVAGLRRTPGAPTGSRTVSTARVITLMMKTVPASRPWKQFKKSLNYIIELFKSKDQNRYRNLYYVDQRYQFHFGFVVGWQSAEREIYLLAGRLSLAGRTPKSQSTRQHCRKAQSFLGKVEYAESCGPRFRACGITCRQQKNARCNQAPEEKER
jgi:hypothetical protein